MAAASSVRALSSALVVWLLLTTVTSRVSFASAAASKESELLCYSTEAEPNEDVACIIAVRNLQREPTMSFDVADFSVAATSSESRARVEVSPLRRGEDITTITFAVRASMGTELVVHAAFDPVGPVSASLSKGSLRNSGLTISVLTWPAVELGAITCDHSAATDGLALRNSTVCSLPLTNADGRPAVLHRGDVTFSESNLLGSFRFLSGKGSLEFEFSAPAVLSVAVTRFTLYVILDVPSHSIRMTRSVALPLVYPALAPEAAHSYLRCADETRPIVCTIAAADGIGPVLYRESDFAIRMETEATDGGAEVWLDNGLDFDFRYTNANSSTVFTNASDEHSTIQVNAARRDLGFVSWSLRVNNAIRWQRFHVYVVSQGEEVRGFSREREVRGSPYEFMSGVVPTATSVTLRGCNVTSIRARRRATCYADLSNGVSGDVRYFLFTSTHDAVFSDMAYLEHDPVTRARAVVVVYTAPTVTVRTDDFISVFLKDSGEAMNTPFRINVFPVTDSGGGGNGGDDRGTAVIVGAGLVLYGGVLMAGLVLVVRRSRTIHRIREERAAKRERLEQQQQQQQ